MAEVAVAVAVAVTVAPAAAAMGWAAVEWEVVASVEGGLAVEARAPEMAEIQVEASTAAGVPEVVAPEVEALAEAAREAEAKAAAAATMEEVWMVEGWKGAVDRAREAGEAGDR